MAPQPDPILHLFFSILVIWICGIGLAYMMGGPALAQRYVTKSTKMLLKVIRAIIAWILETAASLIQWAAKQIR